MTEYYPVQMCISTNFQIFSSWGQIGGSDNGQALASQSVTATLVLYREKVSVASAVNSVAPEAVQPYLLPFCSSERWPCFSA
eukprot:9774781-Ditylum_brightwellii.AAC.2